MIPEVVEEVKRTPFYDAVKDGMVVVFDPVPEYIEQIKRLVDLESIKQAGFKILVDPMWGNGIGWFPKLLAGGKTQIEEIHNVRNPIFPEMSRPEPIPPNVKCRACGELKNAEQMY